MRILATGGLYGEARAPNYHDRRKFPRYRSPPTVNTELNGLCDATRRARLTNDDGARPVVLPLGAFFKNWVFLQPRILPDDLARGSSQEKEPRLPIWAFPTDLPRYFGDPYNRGNAVSGAWMSFLSFLLFYFSVHIYLSTYLTIYLSIYSSVPLSTRFTLFRSTPHSVPSLSARAKRASIARSLNTRRNDVSSFTR